MELRRDKNSSFGNNTTPQLDIAITGTYGFWTKTRPAGATAASVGIGDQTVTVSDGYNVGVGDVMIIDSERMIVTDANFVDTSIAYTGVSTASAAANVMGVPDGTKFVVGEVLLIDTEWMLILGITGNNLTVKRAWDASILTVHSNATTIWARRSLSVERGALGTTAATHLNAAPIVVSDVPGLVRQLAIAEAEVWIAQEPTAYSGAAGPQKPVTAGRGGYSVSEPVAGAGIMDLRQRVQNSRFTRKARSRAI
jgi:hypothetical protein